MRNLNDFYKTLKSNCDLREILLSFESETLHVCLNKKSYSLVTSGGQISQPLGLGLIYFMTFYEQNGGPYIEQTIS